MSASVYRRKHGSRGGASQRGRRRRLHGSRRQAASPAVAGSSGSLRQATLQPSTGCMLTPGCKSTTSGAPPLASSWLTVAAVLPGLWRGLM